MAIDRIPCLATLTKRAIDSRFHSWRDVQLRVPRNEFVSLVIGQKFQVQIYNLLILNFKHNQMSMA